MLLAFLLAAAPPIERPAPCAAANLDFAPRANRISVSGPVRCTLSDVHRLLPDAPLDAVAPNVWLLRADLHLLDGATLVVDGAARGGDADELRLLSEPKGYVELRAEWGTVLLRDTRVTSWDPGAGGPDTVHEDGRAFVRVVSWLDGDVPRESRMDVLRSDVGHLGHYAAESYGLTWKVRDPTPEVFDVVDVFGDVVGSTIHHNYFGMYTYGAHGMRILDNEVHDNVRYGIDPHDDSDALLVEGNVTRDNGDHGFICSKRCDGLVVRGNTALRNLGSGFMFHRGVTDSVLAENLAEGNRDAGFALMDSHGNTVRDNVARRNAHGVRLSVGSSGNVIAGNELCDNARHGIWLYQGADAPTINDGRPVANTFEANDVCRSGTIGLRASAATGNTFVGNRITDSAEHAAFLFDAADNRFVANDLGGSWLRLDGASDTTIADSDAAGIRLDGDDIAVTFTDARGRVYRGPRATTVGAEGSVLSFDGADATGLVEVEAVPLVVAPEDGDVDVVVDAWGPTRRAWTTTPGSASAARFVVTGLAPGSVHALTMDGSPARPLTADNDGEVAFQGEVGDPRSFVLTSAAGIGPQGVGAAR